MSRVLVVAVVMVVTMAMVVIGANTPNVMVMALLGRTLVCLKANDLFTIFTQLAIHNAGAIFCVVESIDKGLDNIGVVI